MSGRLPQKTVVAITAYSCITSSIPNHASFISNFSKTRKKKKQLSAADSQERPSSRAHEKKKEKKPLSLEERERTSETGDRGACREKSPSLLCRDEPRAAYIDGETEGKCSLGMTAESRSKFGAQKKKKKSSQESSRCIPVVLRTHTCTHTQHIMYNMPDRWLKETSTRGVIKTKPVVVLEGSPGTWREKRPPYLTVMCAHISHKPRSYSDRKRRPNSETPKGEPPTTIQRAGVLPPHTEALSGWYCQEWRIILWNPVCVEKLQSYSGQERATPAGFWRGDANQVHATVICDPLSWCSASLWAENNNSATSNYFSFWDFQHFGINRHMSVFLFFFLRIEPVKMP